MSSSFFSPVVACDVDDTLLDGDGVLNDDVVSLLKILDKLGCKIVIWSNGNKVFPDGSEIVGIDYAKHVRDTICERYGFVASVSHKGSFRPDICIDDVDPYTRITEKTFGLVNIQVKKDTQ